MLTINDTKRILFANWARVSYGKSHDLSCVSFKKKKRIKTTCNYLVLEAILPPASSTKYFFPTPNIPRSSDCSDFDSGRRLQ